MTIHEYVLKYVDQDFVGELPFSVTFKSFNKNGLINNKIYFEKILSYFDGECC